MKKGPLSAHAQPFLLEMSFTPKQYELVPPDLVDKLRIQHEAAVPVRGKSPFYNCTQYLSRIKKKPQVNNCIQYLSRFKAHLIIVVSMRLLVLMSVPVKAHVIIAFSMTLLATVPVQG